MNMINLIAFESFRSRPDCLSIQPCGLGVKRSNLGAETGGCDRVKISSDQLIGITLQRVPPLQRHGRSDQGIQGLILNSFNPSKAQRRRFVRSWIRFGFGVLIALAILFVGFIGPAIVNRDDRLHRSFVSFSMREAVPETGSSVNRTGLGSSQSEVVLETKDCGTLLLRQGVTDSNKTRIARYLNTHRNVELEVGDASYRLRHVFNFIRRDPSVYSYRAND